MKKYRKMLNYISNNFLEVFILSIFGLAMIGAVYECSTETTYIDSDGYECTDYSETHKDCYKRNIGE